MNGAFSNGTATITANSTLQINASQTIGALVIGDGVEVTFGDGLPFAPAPEKFGATGVVPEPGALALLMVGALGVFGRRRRAVQAGVSGTN